MKTLAIFISVLAFSIQSANSAEPCGQAQAILRPLADGVANFSVINSALKQEHENPQFSFNVVSQGEICFELGKKDSEVWALWLSLTALAACLDVPYSDLNSFRESLRKTSLAYCHEGKYGVFRKIEKGSAVKSLEEIQLKARVLRDAVYSALNP